MFGNDFFPTPREVIIDEMLSGENIDGKVCFDPEGGKGDIVDVLKEFGASQVLSCETNKDLREILSKKCKVIAHDFLQVTSDQVSHVDFIFMNPPFSADEKHIIHAWNIAPDGCRIIALCNLATLQNWDRSKYRKQLTKLIEMNGYYKDLGECFSTAQRSTDVDIALIKIQKPAKEGQDDFSGFFLENDPEEPQANAIMSYNVVRDLVNRYVAAVKIFDKQLDTAVQLNELIGTFFNEKVGFQCNKENYQTNRNEFKKDLQRAGWKYIFGKLNMEKFSTRGLMADINKFVEQQQQIPFTMRNIYHMLDIVIGTQASRMDRAIEEVFDKITEHTADNRFHVEGWKSNSHFLLPKMFVLPWMVDNRYRYDLDKPYYSINYGGNRDLVDDMIKAMCFVSGTNYENTTSLSNFVSNLKCQWGRWYCWGFFEIKGHKKGTMHFKFQDDELWAKFNQNISRIKGYPLYEPREQTAYQKRNTGRKNKAA